MDLKDLYIGREVYYVKDFYFLDFDYLNKRELKKSIIKAIVPKTNYSSGESYLVGMLNGDEVEVSPQKEENPTSVSIFLSEEEEKQNKLECYKHLLKKYEGYLKENKERIEELKQLLSERSED